MTGNNKVKFNPGEISKRQKGVIYLPGNYLPQISLLSMASFYGSGFGSDVGAYCVDEGSETDQNLRRQYKTVLPL